MKNRVISLITALSMLCAIFPIFEISALADGGSSMVTTAVPIGNGTAESPYRIGTKAELYWFAEEVNSGNGDINAVLTADITVNENVLLGGALNESLKDSFDVWIPISNYSGTFDGQGYAVKGLYCDNSMSGLFATLNYNSMYGPYGTITNVGVTDSYISGTTDAGAICGVISFSANISNCYSVGNRIKSGVYAGGICGLSNTGTITGCYNTSTVIGNETNPNAEDYVGGICGDNDGTIKNCYNIGKIRGRDFVGGIAGQSIGAITGCYSTGTTNEEIVVGASARYQGGICGKNSVGSDEDGSITRCYFDSANTTWAVGNTMYNGVQDNVAGKSAADFESGLVAYLLNESKSEGDLVWGQNLANGADKDASPVFNNGKNTVYYYSADNKYHNHTQTVCDMCDLPVGDGTADSPYQISDMGELYWFAEKVNGGRTDINAVLTADITVNKNVLKNGDVNTSAIDTFKAWTPINSYEGKFDGQGHVISGLYIKNHDSNTYVGMFRKIESSASVLNVGVVDSYFEKGDNIGGICGYNCGTISSSYFIGILYGSYLGGICGNNDGTIADCYCNSTILENGAVGKGNGTVMRTSEKTDTQFRNGEVVYLLNGSKSEGELVWGKMRADAYPKAHNSSNTVYMTAEDGCFYGTNDSSLKGFQKTHTYDENGKCTSCGGFKEPELDSENSRYKISNMGELYWFAEKVNSGENDINAVLTADIELNDGSVINLVDGTAVNGNFRKWMPIGDSNNKYVGTFDGQNHVISGLYYSGRGIHKIFVGLFGYIGKGGSVSNIEVAYSYFRGSQFIGGICGMNEKGTISNCRSLSSVGGLVDYFGGICGWNLGTIINCNNAGVIVGRDNSGIFKDSSSGNDFTGGICGANGNSTVSGTITNCYNSGNLINILCGGGVCSNNQKLSTITNCYNIGTINGDSNGSSVGGVCADNRGTISDSYNIGSVKGVKDEVIVGGVCALNNATVERCYNMGAIGATGENACVGGICGANNKDNVSYYTAVLSNCYNKGNVSAEGAYAYGGGIIGLNQGNVKNCYAKGTVSVNGDGTWSGGVCATNSEGLSNCYYDNELCSDSAIGKTVNIVRIYYDEDDEYGMGYDVDVEIVEEKVEGKTSTEFGDGSVAYLLQNAQPADGITGVVPLVWGQKLAQYGNDVPILTSNIEKAVRKVTFATAENPKFAVKYVNNDKTVELPTEPITDKGKFYKWSKTNSADGEEFTSETTVTEDITLYAVGEEKYGETVGEKRISTIYGVEVTQDLSRYAVFESYTPADGGNPSSGTQSTEKFDYKIEKIVKDGAEINDLAEIAEIATISGDILTVQNTAATGDYTLTIKATEKVPELSLMSNTFDTLPFEIEIALTVAKADSAVTTVPFGKTGLVYSGDDLELVEGGVSAGGTLVYSLDKTAWSASVPKGREAKNYIVYYKVEGNENYNGIDAVEEINVAIAPLAEETTNVAVDYANEVLTGFVSGEYTIDGKSVTIVNGTIAVSGYMGKTILIVKKASDTNHTDSVPQSLLVPTRQSAPTESDFTVTQPSKIGGTGSIVGITADMEYSTDGAEWTVGNGNTIENISGGTRYAVRYKATDNRFKSAEYIISVNVFGAEPEETPTVEIDYANEMLTGFENGEYTIDGASVTGADGKVAAADYMGKTISIVKLGNTTTTIDSAPQSLIVPARPNPPTESNFIVTQPSEIGGTGSIDGVTADMEYSTDGGVTWTAGDGKTIKNIASGTKCTVRCKATDNSFKSDSCEIAVGNFDGVKEEKPQVTIDYEIKSLSGLQSDAEYAITDKNGVVVNVKADKDGLLYVGDYDGTIKLVKKGDKTTTIDSDPLEVELPSVREVPSVKGGKEQISGLTVGMQYRKLGDAEWISAEGVQKLESGKYEVRYAKSEGYYPSDSVTVTVRAKTRGGSSGGSKVAVPTPQVSPDVQQNRDENVVNEPNKPIEEKESLPFADVSVDAWYYADVHNVYMKGLMKGVTDTLFAPDTEVTRAMFVAIIYRMENSPEVAEVNKFADVSEDAYYAKAVVWAVSNDIVSGISETEFAPSANITREQMAAMMFRYAKYKEYDVSVDENTNILSYTDFDGISEYAISAMQYAVGSGLITGKTVNTLNPKEFATRAETAAILHRFITNQK